MMRPRSIYISKETHDMLRACQTLSDAETLDQVADELLRRELENMPWVIRLVQLRKETEQQFEQKAAEIIQASHDTRPSSPA